MIFDRNSNWFLIIEDRQEPIERESYILAMDGLQKEGKHRFDIAKYDTQVSIHQNLYRSRLPKL